ncbi:MAG: DUF2520 domain-containing protein [candidate division KSB1 bacterium]|nr:DUF2520 domain-containing protein [candidate division KSB1 bacterium]
MVEKVLAEAARESLRQLLGKTAVIGLGRVGRAWSDLLRRVGVPLLLYDIEPERIDRLTKGLAPGAEGSTPKEIARKAETVFLTVADDQIRAAAEALAEHSPRFRLAVHMSGARSAEELGPLAELGVPVGSLHPIQTFRGAEEEWRLFLGGGFAIEGDSRALAMTQRIVELLGGRAVRVATRDKALYHAACVVASNFLVCLWNLVERLCLEAGLTPGEARSLLGPLAERTVENLLAAGPLLSLTGPYARGDGETVRRHVEVLNRSVGAQERELYFVLATHTVQLACDAGYLTPPRRERLLEVLRHLDVPGAQEMEQPFRLSPED